MDMILSRIKNNLELQRYGSIKEIKKIFTLLRPYLWNYKKSYFGLFILLFLDIALTLLFAWFFGNITDAAIHADFKRLKWLMGFGVLISLISILSNFLQTYLETIAVNAVKRDLKLHLYEHTLLLPGRNLSELHSGELLSHFTNDVNHIDSVIGRGLINLVRFPLITTAAFIYLIQISWKLSLISLLVAPFAVFGGALFGFLLRNNSRNIHMLISSINKTLTDTFHGFIVIKSFTLERTFFNKYILKNNKLYQLELKDAKLRGAFHAGGEAIGSLTFLTSLIAGAFFVSSNAITIGALMSFVSLINHLVYPLTGLAGQWAGYQRSIAALERVLNLLNQARDTAVLPSYEHPKVIHHGISFKDVTFSYDGKNNVFEKFNLDIPVGKAFAIVGPSGAGKSTLFNLLQNFYCPQKGTITIDNKKMEDENLSSWRNLIAYVPQDTFLFSGTVRENLLLARRNVSEKQMIDATMKANLHQFIVSLPEGYNTEIGERGIKLSGGQRQRLAIARAILKDAPILLLDEATSALDSETELLVQEALHQLMINRTTLIISHRISTVKHADCIIVMENGNVVQSGKHDELIKEKGIYQELTKHQFIKESKEPTQLIV